MMTVCRLRGYKWLEHYFLNENLQSYLLGSLRDLSLPMLAADSNLEVCRGEKCVA